MDPTLLPAALYAALLALAAWQDLRRGEVDGRLLRGLVAAGLIGLALNGVARPALYVLALLGLLAIALNRAGWMGGADVAALASLAAAAPSHPVLGRTPLPFPVAAFALALLLCTAWLAVRGAWGVLRSGRAARAGLVTLGVALVVLAGGGSSAPGASRPLAASAEGSGALLQLLDLVLLALLLQYLARLSRRGGVEDPAGEVRFLPALAASLGLHLALGDPLGLLFKVI